MLTQTERKIIPPSTPLLIAIDADGMSLSDIQEFYDRLSKKYRMLSVKAYFVHTDEESIKLTGSAFRKLDYDGLYIEWPFRKIFLNANNFTIRTVYHEVFHHLNPNLRDGEKFERLLDRFMQEEYL